MKSAKKPPVPRMAPAERKALILAQATDFFSEYGFTAQTRALAKQCGITQRLLYRYFPSKAALLAEVYREAVVEPFKSTWLVQLRDRTVPIEQRLIDFYSSYYADVFTRKWLRLFLFSSLAQAHMAPDYIGAVVMELLETIVTEVAEDQRVELPRERPLLHEIGWLLHGAVSHLAIRRQIYGTSHKVPEHSVVALQVRGFLGGFAAMVTRAKAT